eukprot:2799829-Rhodomonas_salina.1
MLFAGQPLYQSSPAQPQEHRDRDRDRETERQRQRDRETEAETETETETETHDTWVERLVRLSVVLQMQMTVLWISTTASHL